MAIAWRICRALHADLSGTGARLYGGRWNSPGRPLVYAAADAALAVLEIRVHLDLPPHLIPDDYLLVRINCPDLEPETMLEPPARPRAAGDAWLASGRVALLSVPSFIVPESRNILINPAHTDASRIGIDAMRPFRFDERLWSAGPA